VPKLYAPNGSQDQPLSGIGDEVTDIDSKSATPGREVPRGESPRDGDVPEETRPAAGGVGEPDESVTGLGVRATDRGVDSGDGGSGRTRTPVSPRRESSRQESGRRTLRRYVLSFVGVVSGVVTQTYRRGVEIELMHRAFGFAALGFVTLVPLLIVVAAAAPLNGRTFPEWVIAGVGLSGRASNAINRLFGPTNRVLSTTTAFSLAVLAVFGLSFAAMVQTGMARVWELPAARLLSVWRQALWLAALVGLLLVGADLLGLLHDGWFITTLRWCATTVGATLFFWWTPRFLLEGRVPWRALLPGAVLTVMGLVGLRAFSAAIFAPLLVSSAITYGGIGAVLILVTWLIGIGYVIFGAALVGRVVYEVWGGGTA
jgi:membrane protein